MKLHNAAITYDYDERLNAYRRNSARMMDRRIVRGAAALIAFGAIWSGIAGAYALPEPAPVS